MSTGTGLVVAHHTEFILSNYLLSEGGVGLVACTA